LREPPELAPAIGRVTAPARTRAPTLHPLLVLQRAIGNRAVNAVMRQPEHETPTERDLRHAREHDAVAGDWSARRPATVWASQSDTSQIPREDARVRADEVGQGEPGWDLGLQYTTLDDLINQLRSHRVYVGTVQRLAINCHGAPGLLRLEPFANGQDLVHLIDSRRLQGIVEGRNELPADSAGPEDPQYRDHREYYARIVDSLRTIARFLTPSGTVLVVGCIAASGDPGTRLLRVLASPQVLNHTVVGFTRILSAEGQLADQAIGRSLPGGRVTDLAHPTELQGARRTDDLGRRGRSGDWANENSPAARAAGPDGRVWSNSESGSPAELEPWEVDQGAGWGAQMPASAPPTPLRVRPARTLHHGQRVRDPVTGQWRRI
jgi:hypothetical protein